MIDFFELSEKSTAPLARIKVIGVGGAGGNTINSMVASGFEHVEFIATNTDAQALEKSKAHHTIQLGTKLTKGLGSGANPEIGKRAMEEDLESINAHLVDADIVFLTAGLGGGTGSGGAPVVARALRERGILSIAVVTKPFAFEGKRRIRVAHEAIQQLKGSVDTLIVIPNQKLLELSEPNLSLMNAFDMINVFLGQFVRSISDIIIRHGHINVDFADIQAIMRNSGSAVMGTGRASGAQRAEKATLDAISSPLLEESGVKGARGVLINITGNSDLGIHEVSAAAQLIYEQADEDASIVLGSVIDENMGDEVAVTIIATGFERQPEAIKNEAEPVAIKPTQYDPRPLATETHTSGTIQEQPITTQDPLEVPALLRKLAQEQQQKN